ncbi:MAG TPA: transaldolase family protein, partial [Burkholderiaceae bacterium]|nr:transaldolase family protein [Burkholderiaceae bacterium]
MLEAHRALDARGRWLGNRLARAGFLTARPAVRRLHICRRPAHRHPRLEPPMTQATRLLHDLGQSLWLDNISRDLLRSGELGRLIAEDSVTGLTSNPTIFEKAMAQGDAYDADIARFARAGRSVEDVFFALAIDDLRQAASLFEAVYRDTNGG